MGVGVGVRARTRVRLGMGRREVMMLMLVVVVRVAAVVGVVVVVRQGTGRRGGGVGRVVQIAGAHFMRRKRKRKTDGWMGDEGDVTAGRGPGERG